MELKKESPKADRHNGHEVKDNAKGTKRKRLKQYELVTMWSNPVGVLSLKIG